MKLQVFNNSELNLNIRTLEKDREPWFVGKDIAESLGYSNPRKALADHVDEEDKGVTKCDTLGGKQEIIIINESGLYSLVLSSKLPTAKKFKRWITLEVLPTIRKNGSYQIPQLPMSKELKAIFMLDEKQEKLEGKVQGVEKKVDNLEANMPLFNIDCEELQKAVRKIGLKVLGGKSSNAYRDKSIRTKVYSDIQQQIKREFGLNSYKAIKRSQLDIAKEIIEKYQVPLVLNDEITCLNN